MREYKMMARQRNTPITGLENREGLGRPPRTNLFSTSGENPGDPV